MNEPNPDTRIPELMSATQVGVVFNITRQAVIKAANQGDLPARRVGTVWAFLKSGIDELALERAKKSEDSGRATSGNKTPGHSIL